MVASTTASSSPVRPAPPGPDPDRHRHYQAPLAAYRALCDQVAPIFERLAGVSGGAAGA